MTCLLQTVNSVGFASDTGGIDQGRGPSGQWGNADDRRVQNQQKEIERDADGEAGKAVSGGGKAAFGGGQSGPLCRTEKAFLTAIDQKMPEQCKTREYAEQDDMCEVAIGDDMGE